MRSLLFAALASVAAGTSAKAEVAARAWLRDHPDSHMDQLAELKDENPDAYALVKTLLMKRSLGLLDPRHPTASFSKTPVQDSGEHAVGAAVYSKFATTEKEKAALQAAPYAEVASPSSQNHDWLNWKPKDSAVDDDSMVKNVLGQVADLTGGKSQAAPAPTYSQSSLDADEASILAADDAPVQKAKPETATPAPTQAPAHNFLSKAPEATEAPKSSSENSYLKGLDLTVDDSAAPPTPTVAAVAEAPMKPMKVAAKSALDSFSFDDASTPAATTTEAPVVEQKAASKPSALGSWLGLVKPHVQPAAQKVEDAPAVTPAAQAENPYLADLQ